MTAFSELPPGLRWRMLASDDFDAVYRLHLASICDQTPEVIKPESAEFLAALLAARGRLVGVESSDSLVAYGVLQHDLDPQELPAASTGIVAQTRLLKLAGAAVTHAWRGHGLQRFLIGARVRLAGDDAWLISTASPRNRPSWTNLMSQGFEARDLVLRYGGFRRWVMVREPATEASAAFAHAKTSSVAAAVCEVALDAFEEQEALFRDGWRGVAASDDGTNLCLVRLR